MALNALEQQQLDERKKKDPTLTSERAPIVLDPEEASRRFGATSFDDLDVLPGEVSGVEKLQKQGFIEGVKEARKDPRFEEAIKGKGLSLEELMEQQRNTLFFNPDLPRGGLDVGLRAGEFIDPITGQIKSGTVGGPSGATFRGGKRVDESDGSVTPSPLGAYNPPQPSPNASPLENAFAKSQYDLRYSQSSLSAFQTESEKTRKGVGSAQERSGVEQEQFETQKKGEELDFGTGKTVANPEYTKLSENAKKLNQQRKDAGKSFVPEKITDETGRRPIQRQMTHEQRVAAQSLSSTVSRLGDNALEVLTENFDLLSPAQKGAARDFINTTKARQEREATEGISQNIAEELNAEERLVRAELNMSPTDELTFTDDGQPLINQKTVSEDAISRANEDVQEAKDEWLETNNKDHANSLARIRSANTVDGNLTDRGRQELADAEREFAKNRDKKFKEIDGNLETFENKQKANQAKIDIGITQANSVTGRLQRKLAQDKATGAYNIQLEQAKSGNEIGFSAAIKEYEKRQDFSEKTPKYADIAKALDTKIMTPSFDKTLAFDTVIQDFDNDVVNTEKYLKSRGFLEKDIKAQKQAYQIEVLGYSPEDVEDEKKKERVETLFQKSLDGEQLSMRELDQVALYEAEHPKEARRIELKKTTNLSNAEIWKQTAEEFKADPKAKKVSSKSIKGLSSGGTKFMRDNPDFDIDVISTEKTRYNLSSNDKQILMQQLIDEEDAEESEVEEVVEEETTPTETVPTEEEEKTLFQRFKSLFQTKDKKEKKASGSAALEKLRSIK